MAQIIQLSLNFGKAPVSGPRVLQSVIDRAAIPDPCKHCELREVCDSDDCGQHLFSLDTPTKFRNLNEFINFKKSQGWG